MGKKEKDERFRQFGTVSFTGTTRINDFIDRLATGRVSGTRCDGCGKVYFPPRADCSHCRTADMEWVDLPDTGKLVTFSTLAFGPRGFEGDLPYTIALVDFGTCKAFGRMAGGIDDAELAIGMPLKAKANPLADGRFNYVFDKA